MCMVNTRACTLAKVAAESSGEETCNRWVPEALSSVPVCSKMFSCHSVETGVAIYKRIYGPWAWTLSMLPRKIRSAHGHR